jgi:metallo-beta-lactamase family protein
MNSLTFKGAVNEVTGSKIEIRSYQHTLLMDHGLVQGHRDQAYIQNREFALNPLNPDFCVLTHSHLDHSGLLPTLNNVPIYATHATTELCKYMLPDALKVMTKDLDVIKRMFKRKKIKMVVEPLYTEEQVESCIHNFKSIDYEKWTRLTPEIKFKLLDSCHILGSASVEVDINQRGTHHRVYYTSDLGHDKSLLHHTPKVPQNITHLIIETTYGNKTRSKKNPQDQILDDIWQTYKRGGRIIIPAFSVARTQSIILMLHKLYRENALPDIPIYADSPLGNNVTEVYARHKELLNQETLEYFERQGFDPFHFPNLEYVNDMERTEAISKGSDPCIIISSSGMAEGGKIREYLKDNIGGKKNHVCFVGYCAEGTLGERLQNTGGLVSIDGRNRRVRCTVDYVEGFSSHADVDYIIDYIERASKLNKLKTIYLVHGEKNSSENVKKILEQKGYTNVVIPEKNKEYKL